MTTSPETMINVNGTSVAASAVSVPTNREFRGAWALDGAVITIDMDQAKEIHKDKLRELRLPELAKLDTAFMKLLETGGDTAAVTAQKQAYRDVTNDARIANATTPDELSALTLEVLIA